jgi:hypothetical protein
MQLVALANEVVGHGHRLLDLPAPFLHSNPLAHSPRPPPSL